MLKNLFILYFCFQAMRFAEGFDLQLASILQNMHTTDSKSILDVKMKIVIHLLKIRISDYIKSKKQKAKLEIDNGGAIHSLQRELQPSSSSVKDEIKKKQTPEKELIKNMSELQTSNNDHESVFFVKEKSDWLKKRYIFALEKYIYKGKKKRKIQNIRINNHFIKMIEFFDKKLKLFMKIKENMDTEDFKHIVILEYVSLHDDNIDFHINLKSYNQKIKNEKLKHNQESSNVLIKQSSFDLYRENCAIILGSSNKFVNELYECKKKTILNLRELGNLKEAVNDAEKRKNYIKITSEFRNIYDITISLSFLNEFEYIYRETRNMYLESLLTGFDEIINELK